MAIKGLLLFVRAGDSGGSAGLKTSWFIRICAVSYVRLNTEKVGKRRKRENI